jgi:hypothetical protein
MDELNAFFSGQAYARQLFVALNELVQSLGPVELRVTKSQVAFRRKTLRSNATFAAAWMPEKVLKRRAAPLVLTVFLRSRDPSPRWKEIVEPYPGRFTHHLELYEVEALDEQVRGWLQQAWELAG